MRSDRAKFGLTLGFGASLLLTAGCSDMALFMNGPRIIQQKISFEIGDDGQLSIAAPSNALGSKTYAIYASEREASAPVLSLKNETSETFYTIQTSERGSRLQLSNRATRIGYLTAGERFHWEQILDASRSYAFELRSEEPGDTAVSQAYLLDIHFAAANTQTVTVKKNGVHVKWSSVQGATAYGIEKNGVLLRTSDKASDIFAFEEAQKAETFCVRPQRGALKAADCTVIKGLGESWTPHAVALSVPSGTPEFLKIGDKLRFKISYTDPIQVPANARLAAPLAFAVPRLASYVSGSGTATLVFEYTIQAGDSVLGLPLGENLHVADGQMLVDEHGRKAEMKLPRFILEDLSGLKIDAQPPTEAQTIQFSSLAVNTLSVPVSWGASQDDFLTGYRAKLCAQNDCATGCQATQLVTSAAASLPGTANSSFYACVQAYDAAGLSSGWRASGQAVTIDTIPPVVGALSDLISRLPVSVTASVSGANRMVWSKVSGPGAVSFTAPLAAATTMSASQDGIYEIRFSAWDDAGNLTTREFELEWDTTAPLVSVGSARSFNAATLVDATSSGAVSYLWSQVAGPGVITFGAASAEDTTVAADMEGVYTVRLTAQDAAGNSAYDEFDMTWDVTAPVVNAGADQLTATQVTLAGTSSEAGVISWTQISGPGTITFGTPAAAHTTASASISGTYDLRMSVTDAAGNVGTDTLSFIWDVTPPSFAGLRSLAVSADQTEAYLSWLMATDVNTRVHNLVYEICESTTLGACASNFVATYTLPHGQLNYHRKGLDPNTVYEYIVRVRDELGNQDLNTKAVRKSLYTTGTKLAAGYDHACAINSDATVSCWGKSSMGQAGSTESRLTQPRVVPGLTQVIDLSAGRQHTCALRTGGTVWCWGSNSFGQLGTGGASSEVPSQVLGLSGVSKINMKNHSSCALTGGGAAVCWGLNTSGQLGVGDAVNRSSPTPVTVASTIVDLALGTNYACAALSDGSVNCWGDNTYGQLGNNTTVSSLTAVPVSGVSGAVSVASGAYHSCSLTAAGAARCWGRNSSGQLGDNSQTNRLVSIAVSGLGSDVVSLGLGSNHTCSASTTGVASCWGSTTSGQIGNSSGPDSSANTPQTVTGISNATQVGAGYDWSCALQSTGRISCWGYAASDATDSIYTTFPKPVVGMGADVLSLSAGGYHSCAALDGGAVKCWGANTYGQSGTGYAVNSPPNTVPSVTNAVQVSAGAQHACALINGGTVRCWGQNNAGQLGDGTTSDRSTGVLVSGLNDVSRVIAHIDRTCSIQTDGTVRCWGSNVAGQFGNGTTTNSTTPVAIPGLSGVQNLYMGYQHACAVLTGGTVSCWGDNTRGQLGDGTTTNQLSPLPISGLTQVVDMALGSFHTCALRSNGEVLCWGSNDYGQVGDNSRVQTNTPKVVTGLAPAQTLNSFGNHTCARIADGSNFCWGYNAYYQGGNNGTADVLSPAPIALPPGTQVSSGLRHACALLPDKSVNCWGNNSYAQTGTATARLPMLMLGH